MATTCRRHQHPSHPPSYSYYYYTSSSPSPSPTAFASSTTTSFGSPARSPSSSSFHHRKQHISSHPHNQHSYQSQGYVPSTSPTRANFVGSGSISSSPSVRFSLDPRSISPSRSLATPIHHHHHHQTHHHHPQAHPHGHHSQYHQRVPQQHRRTCMCSPTTHPGSFRCSLHKSTGCQTGGRCNQQSLSPPSIRQGSMRSSMMNSLVRIGTVEGELAKRTLAASIRPSPHQQNRRASFKPRPSRLSVMSMACDEDNNGDGDVYL